MERDTAYTYQDDGVYIIRISPSRDGSRLRWKVDAYYRNHRKITLTSANFSGPTGRADAEQAAAILWADYVSGLHSAPEAPPLLLGELIERFLGRTKSKKGKELSVQTQRAYRTHLQALVVVAGADKPLVHLHKDHIEKAYQLPKAAASKESYLRDMRILIRWAVKQGWLKTDITESITYDPGEHEMRSWLQADEIEPYLEACEPAHRIRSGFVIETGLRVEEATHLRWSWVTRGVGTPSIRIPKRDEEIGWLAKGKKVRPIPLSERAQAFLAEAEARWGSTGFVLHDQNEAISQSNLVHRTHNACKKAGVTDTDFHGLRRTAGALWILAGIDIYTVSRLLGHESVKTTEKAYAGIADSRLVEAIQRTNERQRLPQVGKARRNKDGSGS